MLEPWRGEFMESVVYCKIFGRQIVRIMLMCSIALRQRLQVRLVGQDKIR
jgi:hypothetical protein